MSLEQIENSDLEPKDSKETNDSGETRVSITDMMKNVTFGEFIDYANYPTFNVLKSESNKNLTLYDIIDSSSYDYKNFVECFDYSEKLNALSFWKKIYGGIYYNYDSNNRYQKILNDIYNQKMKCVDV